MNISIKDKPHHLSYKVLHPNLEFSVPRSYSYSQLGTIRQEPLYVTLLLPKRITFIECGFEDSIINFVVLAIRVSVSKDSSKLSHETKAASILEIISSDVRSAFAFLYANILNAATRHIARP